MRLKVKNVAVFSAIVIASAANAVHADTLSMQDGTDLAKRSACLACHQVDAKRVGPAFVQIAQRYASETGAVDVLTQSIRNGGRGKWGAIPMPAQRQISEEQAEQLAKWILSIKP